MVTPGLASRDIAPLPLLRPPAFAEPERRVSPPPPPVAPVPAAAPPAVSGRVAALANVETSRPGRMTDAETGRPADSARAPRSIEPVRVAPPVTAALPAEPPTRPPVARAVVARATPPAPGFWIQVGAFRSAATAGRVAERVRGEILIAPAGTTAEPLLRVRVGPFANRAQAAARLREFQSLGYQPFIAAER